MSDKFLDALDWTIRRHEQARDFLKEETAIHGREETIISDLQQLRTIYLAHNPKRQGVPAMSNEKLPDGTLRCFYCPRIFGTEDGNIDERAKAFAQHILKTHLADYLDNAFNPPATSKK